MIFFRVLKGKNLNVMPGGNTFQKGRQKTQGFVEKHMLKECLCSRPAVRLWRRNLTCEPGLTQRSKGQGKGKSITYYFPRSLKLIFFQPGVVSQAWNPSAGGGECVRRRGLGIFWVSCTHLESRLWRHIDRRIAGFQPSEKARAPGSRRDPGAKKR